MSHSIHEAIGVSSNTENVELIDVPVEGDAVVLLRTKLMPQFAFVMWVKRKTSTLSQMCFHQQGGEWYPVVCACCASETYGLEVPEDVDPQDWSELHASGFRDSLITTSHKHGIDTLFMRRASAWDRHYGEVDGIRIVEANQHRSVCREMYSKKSAEKALEFIDYFRSQGLRNY